jgi:hypothetical protein
MNERGEKHRVLVGKPEGKRPLKDRGVHGRIILKVFLNKWDMKVWIGLIWLRIQSSGGLLGAWQ